MFFQKIDYLLSCHGTIQYFDYEGRTLWPVDENKLIPLINKQRDVFFTAMIERLNEDTHLMPSEIEDLRLALLASEHPESEENSHLMWSRDVHKTILRLSAMRLPEYPLIWKSYGIEFGLNISSGTKKPYLLATH